MHKPVLSGRCVWRWDCRDISSSSIGMLIIRRWHIRTNEDNGHHLGKDQLLVPGICPQYLGPTVLLIKFLPSLPVTAERGSTSSVPYPPLRATSGRATCSVVGDTYRPVAKLSPAWGWWTLPCLACLLSPHPSSSGQTINWVEEHSDQRLSVREYLIKDQI